jgi:hypothetical protein
MESSLQVQAGEDQEYDPEYMTLRNHETAQRRFRRSNTAPLKEINRMHAAKVKNNVGTLRERRGMGKVVAVQAFQGKDDAELSFEEGDVITLLVISSLRRYSLLSYFSRMLLCIFDPYLPSSPLLMF